MKPLCQLLQCVRRTMVHMIWGKLKDLSKLKKLLYRHAIEVLWCLTMLTLYYKREFKHVVSTFYKEKGPK